MLAKIVGHVASATAAVAAGGVVVADEDEHDVYYSAIMVVPVHVPPTGTLCEFQQMARALWTCATDADAGRASGGCKHSI